MHHSTEITSGLGLAGLAFLPDLLPVPFYGILGYQEMAIEFANDVNNVTHDSFVDKHGSTYKFSYETNEFVILKSDGTVITYFIPEKGEGYWNEQKRKHGI